MERPRVETFTEQDLQTYLAKEGNVTWVTAGDLLNPDLFTSLNCVDGRSTNFTIGTPGGDIAVLHALLQGVEGEIMRPLATEEVKAAVDWWISKIGRLYMHTDEHALATTMNNFAKASRMEFKDPAAFADLIKRPQAYFRDLDANEVLPFLLEEPAIGCGHLNLMMQKRRDYGLPNLALLMLLKERFYKAMWAENPRPGDPRHFVYDVLTGKHKEQAVAVIESTEEAITGATPIPMVKPTDGRTSVFVNHPGVAAWVIRQMTAKLPEIGIEGLKKESGTAVAVHARRLLNLGTQTTVGKLASHLPVIHCQPVYPGSPVRQS